MDEIETTESEETPSFATEVGRAFLISAASAVGMMAGMAIVGAGVQALENRKNRKASKKTQEEQ